MSQAECLSPKLFNIPRDRPFFRRTCIGSSAKTLNSKTPRLLQPEDYRDRDYAQKVQTVKGTKS